VDMIRPQTWEIVVHPIAAFGGMLLPVADGNHTLPVAGEGCPTDTPRRFPSPLPARNDHDASPR